ncbi:MAG: YggS family pyridoxal phosphate-dependent enzyme [Candidatus Symbiobacter sp.]|nr:YggS family pyridoxal phosphate-dependent enzyme [Candidatus Symbiobacter sp.]
MEIAATEIAENLATIHRQIEKIAAESGRDAASIELIAVSKFHPFDRVAAARAAGHHSFGENRVQEAVAKFSSLRPSRDEVTNPPLKLHLVGALQTNKARQAAQFFDAIHALDRENLALELVKIRDQGVALPDLYIQINSGEEPQKSGIFPAAADVFIEKCRAEWQLPVIGLMCVPPAADPPELHFALVAEIAKRHYLPKLSMGMSHDFAAAIQFGATAIRIGTAIFGERPAFATAPASQLGAS